jgi:hypothetical protein
MAVKKNVTFALLLVVAALATAGCKNKPKEETQQNPVMKAVEIPAGTGKKATVAQTMNQGGYTYIEAADDKGEKTWLALPEMKVAAGDNIEYADTPPMMNFTSKTLNKKFDKILFVKGVKVLK